MSRYPWLFGARIDLSVFLGSALLSLLLLGVGHQLGILHEESPEWTWIFAVLVIDVAHVWSTVFRVYFDREERRRRLYLYYGAPLIAYLGGVAIYAAGPLTFWRFAAYLAVFHFVRQQYGWVVMYRRKGREQSRLGTALDTAAIYAATLYPLLYWHSHLPRRFWWFVVGDFTSPIPTWLPDILFPLYLGILLTYALRSAWLYRLGQGNPGKDVVVATTALCWYLGIVSFNSDFAFTVTNVVIHGVPYFALVYLFARRRAAAGKPGLISLALIGPWLFVGVLILFAFGEELLWDRFIWHERSYLFGEGASLEGLAEGLLVPLLALPQITHYLLDGFLWRKRANSLYFDESSSECQVGAKSTLMPVA